MDNEQQTAAAVAARLGTITPGLEVCRVARDGRLIWRRAGSRYDTRSGRYASAKFYNECRAFAAAKQIPWYDDAGHNVEIKAN